MSSDKLSVENLIKGFHESLSFLAPVFESVGLEWKDGKSYDPWDDAARVIFNSIIGSAVDNFISERKIRPLAPYDIFLKSYNGNSYLSDSKKRGAFVRFETESEPFDTCLFSELNEDGYALSSYREKFDSVCFSFVPVYEDGKAGPALFEISFLK